MTTTDLSNEVSKFFRELANSAIKKQGSTEVIVEIYLSKATIGTWETRYPGQMLVPVKLKEGSGYLWVIFKSSMVGVTVYLSWEDKDAPVGLAAAANISTSKDSYLGRIASKAVLKCLRKFLHDVYRSIECTVTLDVENSKGRLINKIEEYPF